MLRVFRHYIPSSLVWLMLIELVVLYLAVYLGVELRFYNSPYSKSILRHLPDAAMTFSLVMLLSMTATGLHSTNVIDNLARLIIRLGLSFLLGLALITLVFYMVPALFVGRAAFGMTMVIAFVGILITRLIYSQIDNNNIFRRKILVLGAGKKAKILEQGRKQYLRRGIDILGFVNIDKYEPVVSKDLIMDIKTTLIDLVEEKQVHEIVLAMDDRRKGFPINSLIECKMNSVVVHDVNHFLEQATGHVNLQVLHPSILIFTEGAIMPGIGKRLFDLGASLTIMTLAAPIMLLTAIAIYLSSMGRDPIFYRQTRIGLCDKPFQVLKFRSMRVDAEKNGAQFAKNNDSRVTFIGAFIRKTRIDELPQIINVLKGEMSFVGPRPERPEFVLGFEQSISHYNLRHTVKPGITGWAQICYPYGDSLEDTKNKLQYDLYYIKNYSLFLDFTILLQTIQVVLFGNGAR